MKEQPQESRIARFIVDDETGCFLWAGAQRNGYGSLTFDGRQAYAHRLAYVLYVGEIPEGWEIHHVCEVRSCINPDHLEALSKTEHRNRSLRVRRTVCPRGHQKKFYPPTPSSPHGLWFCLECNMMRYRARRKALVS